MKKLFIILVILFSLESFGQKTFNLDTIKPKSETGTKTADNAIYNGKSYPIYVSKNNKYYILVTSKKGNIYKKYITDVVIKQ